MNIDQETRNTEVKSSVWRHDVCFPPSDFIISCSIVEIPQATARMSNKKQGILKEKVLCGAMMFAFRLPTSSFLVR
jgi:hypothetical protein